MHKKEVKGIEKEEEKKREKIFLQVAHQRAKHKSNCVRKKNSSWGKFFLHFFCLLALLPCILILCV
jgi:hypothetical protein